MSYYHVYVDMDGDEAEETDLSLEQLTKDIVRPYNQGGKFMCKGVIVHPSDITTFRIIETEQPSSELLPEIKRKKGVLGLLELYGNEVALLAEKGRDVTREFLRIGTEKKRKTSRRKVTTGLSRNVFIVHGRDHGPMKELKTMLLEFGLNPIVLHEQPSGSRTIVEKLEKYSDVGYAFVILTPDERGGPFVGKLPILGAQMLEDSHFRARQNVILEFGYFMGMLGRDRVCCLYKGNIELPSDMHGIVYIPFENSVEEIRLKIMKELKEAGYEIKI